MAEKGIPDFMREFDMNIDYGFTPVSSKPVEQKPGVDKQALDSKFEGTNLELSKVKSDVSTIKSMMKEIEKIVLPFLYNLSKSDEPYIHWPNRGPIIRSQIEKVLKLTRG